MRILWKDEESYGYTDVLPPYLFSQDRNGQPVTHKVVGPRGGIYTAMCVVRISKLTVDLDYRAFEAYNSRQEMCLGILRIQFADRSRSRVSRLQWRRKGTRRFEDAEAEVLPDKVKPVGPYRRRADSAKRARRKVKERPGQIRFRDSLKMAYGGACCLTGCPVPEALEGAHIDPYSGPTSDHPQNGLLLRRDIHALLDLGVLAFEPSKRVAWFAPAILVWSEYRKLHGRAVLRTPEPGYESYGPSSAALMRRWRDFIRAYGIP